MLKAPRESDDDEEHENSSFLASFIISSRDKPW